MSDKLTFLQIGCGGIGAGHLAALAKSPDTTLVAACDTDENVLAPLAARGVATYGDIEKAVEQTEADCALISLPHYLYPTAVCAALRRGMHVLKEKPFGRTLEDAREMVAAAEETKKVLMVAGQTKHLAAFQRAKEFVDAGWLGELVVARGIITYRWENALNENWSWRGTHLLSGGVAVIDSGWHILDLIHWYCGMPSRVYCTLGRGKLLTGEYDVDERAVLSLDFPDGAVGTVTCCFIVQPSNRQIVLNGLEGSLDVTGDRLVLDCADGTRELERFGADPHHLEPQLEAFVRLVREGAEPTAGAREAYQVQRIIDAAYRSAELGKPVEPRR